MSRRRSIEEAKKGSAELVILAIVEHEGHHGYEIAKLIEQRTDGSLRFTLASLYADAGRKVLAEQRADWSRFVAALGQVAGVKYA